MVSVNSLVLCILFAENQPKDEPETSNKPQDEEEAQEEEEPIDDSKLLEQYKRRENLKLKKYKWMCKAPKENFHFTDTIYFFTFIVYWCSISL